MANFSELDRYLFGQATHYEIYRKLGAHFTDQYGIRGVCFDVWAPNAARIWVIGSFNGCCQYVQIKLTNAQDICII